MASLSALSFPLPPSDIDRARTLASAHLFNGGCPNLNVCQELKLLLGCVDLGLAKGVHQAFDEAAACATHSDVSAVKGYVQAIAANLRAGALTEYVSAALRDCPKSAPRVLQERPKSAPIASQEHPGGKKKATTDNFEIILGSCWEHFGVRNASSQKEHRKREN